MYKLLIKKFKIISSKKSVKIITVLTNVFKNLHIKIKKILKYGLLFCLLILFIGIIILLINLIGIHSQNIYEIGLKIFEIGLYYIVFFISSAITVDSLHRNII